MQSAHTSESNCSILASKNRFFLLCVSACAAFWRNKDWNSVMHHAWKAKPDHPTEDGGIVSVVGRSTACVSNLTDGLGLAISYHGVTRRSYQHSSEWSDISSQWVSCGAAFDPLQPEAASANQYSASCYSRNFPATSATHPTLNFDVESNIITTT